MAKREELERQLSALRASMARVQAGGGPGPGPSLRVTVLDLSWRIGFLLEEIEQLEMAEMAGEEEP